MRDMRDMGLKSVAGTVLLLGAGFAHAQSTTPPTPQPQPPAVTTPQSPPPAATTPPPQPPAAREPSDTKMTLTEQQAQSWIDKRVFSKDGKELGEVAGFKRSLDNTVLEMRADIGGLLGIGETRVVLTPEQFKLQDDRVVLNLSEEQVWALPKVPK